MLSPTLGEVASPLLRPSLHDSSRIVCPCEDIQEHLRKIDRVPFHPVSSFPSSSSFTTVVPDLPVSQHAQVVRDHVTNLHLLPRLTRLSSGKPAYG